MTDENKSAAREAQDKDAMLEGGQADYGSAGQQAVEGVNKAKREDDVPEAGASAD